MVVAASWTSTYHPGALSHGSISPHSDEGEVYSICALFLPSDILCILNWLSSALTEGESENKIHYSRAFSSPVRLAFKNGICENRSKNAVLNLELVHSMDASWSKMKDVRIFLYEVVGHYSPPLPEDV